MAWCDPARADAHRAPRVLATANQVSPAVAGPGPAGGARVALVHDWLTGMRGGEKCLEVLCEMFPAAPIYTLVHWKGRLSPTIESHPIHESWIAKMPLGRSRYRWHIASFPKAIESFD